MIKRSLNILCTTVLLVTFLVELLLDPSTNFIRAGVGSKAEIGSGSAVVSIAKDIVKLLTFFVDSSSDEDTQKNSNGLQSLHDVNVCYATASTSYQIKFDIIIERAVLDHTQKYLDKYYPSIFQPPKHS